MKVKFELNIGIHNCSKEMIIDVDDDTSDEDLNNMLNDWIWNHIDCGWSRL